MTTALQRDHDADGLRRLRLGISPVVVIEQGGNHNTVVDDDNPFRINVSWAVGPDETAVLLTGTWTLRAHVESAGPGPEVLAGLVQVQADGGSAYSASIEVAAGTLPSNVDPTVASGVYKVVTVLTYETSLGVSTQLTAFSEGPLFMIRTP
jgi:hypothetical protein